MARKMLMKTGDGDLVILTETPADDEEQLQVLVKDHPELIPLEQFGMTGPVMVVGRETRLQSGAVDLVALARSGDLLVIEFKTGPQNSDFRGALAQLLDYGANLRKLSLEEFESAMAVRHFNSDECQDPQLKGKDSLEDAARAAWKDLTEEELEQLLSTLSRQLETGYCHYVLMAQRFTDTMETTTEYLNSITPSVSFWAVELVRFTGEGVDGFETRTVFESQPGGGRTKRLTDEGELLARISNEPYRESLRDVIAACRGLGIRVNPGGSGLSLRVRILEQPGWVSVTWLFPPERSGWMGLRDWTMGYSLESAETAPSTKPILERFGDSVSRLQGVEETKAEKMRVYRCSPEVLVASKDKIIELMADVASALGDLV